MKTIREFIIVIVAEMLYYFVDATIDFLFNGDLTLSEIAFTRIPAGELPNRVFGMIVIFFAMLYYIRNQREKNPTKPTQIQAEEDPQLSYLNSFSVVEMITVQLKTTMNIVLGFFDMLKDNRVYQHTRIILSDYVYSSASKLMQLLNNLVELHRILNNKIIPKDSTFNLNQLLTDLHEKLKVELEHSNKKNLKLELHLPERDKELIIKTDSNKLSGIITALIQNAIGFSEEGTIKYGFTMAHQKETRFFVHDNGAGFSMDHLEIAFKSYLSENGGMDMSLNLAALRMEVARRLSGLIGAKIWSKSNMGHGSSFYLSFPVHKETRNVRKEENLPITSPDWSNRTILIAEDLDSNFMLLKAMLMKSRVKIIRACNGYEAVDLFRNGTHQFHAVLMDILMPEMDGLEAASHIRKLNSTMPIIGQTAYSIDLEEEKETLKNFDDFLIKPIWSHELIRSLSKYL
jgi:CheY-like chemotaxis protein/signal transduction histidine kinase